MSNIGTIVAFIRTKLGIALVGGILIAVAIWAFSSGGGPEEQLIAATRGEFVQQVSISGKVIPAQEVQLGFTQSGRISNVSVRVGNSVGAGTVLAQIDSADVRAQLLQKEAAYDAQKAKLAALMQGTRPEEIAVAQSAVESSAASLTQAREALADAIRDARIKTVDTVYNNVYQFVTNPKTDPQLSFSSSDSQAVLDSRTGILLVENEFSLWLNETNDINESNLALNTTRAQKHLSVVTNMLNSVTKALNAAFPTTVSQATINGYETGLATSRSVVSTATAAITTAITAEKNAVSALDSAKKNLSLKQAGTVQPDIDAQAAQVKSAEAEVANARSQVNKTVIIAPFSGIITKVDAKVGKIVSPNTPEVSMNSSAKFQIESYIPEVNIASIKIGDVSSVTLDAYGDEVLFTATVISIDPAETIKDGVPTYRALLEFSGTDTRIRSGMTANIVVTTEKRSDVLSIPQGLVASKEGKKTVQVLVNGIPEERVVTTGSISSLGSIEILTGLAEGDMVIVVSGE